jgi:hypothetical protein
LEANVLPAEDLACQAHFQVVAVLSGGFSDLCSDAQVACRKIPAKRMARVKDKNLVIRHQWSVKYRERRQGWHKSVAGAA